MDLQKTIAEAKRSQLQFIKAELGTSATFAQRALTTQDADTRRRNRNHARTGYDTLCNVLAKAQLDPEEVQSIGADMNRLKQQLLRLGEVFDDQRRD